MAKQRQAKRSRASGSIGREVYWIRGANGVRVERRETAWYYVRWTDAQGRRCKLRAAPTLGQAREILAQKLAEAADERAGIKRFEATGILLSGLAAKYLEARKPHVTEKQLRALRSELEEAFAGAGATYLADLTREKVERWLQGLADLDRSPRTINKKLITVKGMFRWLCRVGELPRDRDPVEAIARRPQHEKKRERRALVPDEVRRLLEAAGRKVGGYSKWARPWEQITYATAIYTGLRANEIRSLRWSAVDLEAGTIRLPAVCEKARRGALLQLHPVMRELLQAELERRKAEPRESVCRIPYKPLSTFYKTLSIAGIPRVDAAGRVVDFHALRHTFGTELARVSVNPSTAQLLMRHASPQMTAIYTHPSAELERAGIGALPDYRRLPVVGGEVEGSEGGGVEGGSSLGTASTVVEAIRGVSGRVEAEDVDRMISQISQSMEQIVADWQTVRARVAGRRGLEPPTLGSTTTRDQHHNAHPPTPLQPHHPAHSAQPRHDTDPFHSIGSVAAAPPPPPVLDAVDPATLIVRGDSALPFIPDGAAVTFDRGRPNDVRPGELCVAIHPGWPAPVLKRLRDAGGLRLFDSLNQSREYLEAGTLSDPDNLAVAYPLVEVLFRYRRRGTTT